MDYDEKLILEYLRARPRYFISVKEISRDVGDRRRFKDNPNWAKRPLITLVEKGLVEADEMGHYRFTAGISCTQDRSR